MRHCKRITALVLSILLIAALPVSVSARADGAQIQQTVSKHYRLTLSACGRESMNGWCGLQAGYLLYYMGVEDYPVPLDGNAFFDYYRDKEQTSGGYRIQQYPASAYTLEEALNAVSNNGTRDVYNLLAGFERTDTEVGARCGHVVIVYAILDGMVYAAESFSSSLGMEGVATQCTIAEFARYYRSWAEFEGVIYFGEKQYTDLCHLYATDMFVSVRCDTPLLSQPRSPAEQQVQILRKARAGERLRVTGVYRNTEGAFFYQALDEGGACYLAAGDAKRLRINLEDVTICDVADIEILSLGGAFQPDGKVQAKNSILQAVRVIICDDANTPVLSDTLHAVGRTCRLRDGSLDVGSLPAGQYTYRIYGDVVSYDVLGDSVRGISCGVLLWDSAFQVLDGGAPPEAEPKPLKGQSEQADGSEFHIQMGVQLDALLHKAASPSAHPEGWSWDGQTWYYYENGAPRTGWLQDDGIWYYLDADGAVTTGRATLEGEDRYFTQTGALRTGWLETDGGRLYLGDNGAAVHGWQKVEGGWAYLDEDAGIACTDCWIEQGFSRYYLDSAGVSVTGWVELAEGVFCFRPDGRLFAQRVAQGETSSTRIYHEQTGRMQLGALPTDVKEISGTVK